MFPAKFAREALTKSAVLYRSFFQRHWPRKFPRDSREITRFFREFVPENTARFDFFSRDLPGALGGGVALGLGVRCLGWFAGSGRRFGSSTREAWTRVGGSGTKRGRRTWERGWGDVASAP